MKKIIQLDAIRGIAIILVLIQHWVPGTNSINKIPNGALNLLFENLTLTLLVAWLSYTCIELPILRFKKTFEYKK